MYTFVPSESDRDCRYSTFKNIEQGKKFVEKYSTLKRFAVTLKHYEIYGELKEITYNALNELDLKNLTHDFNLNWIVIQWTDEFLPHTLYASQLNFQCGIINVQSRNGNLGDEVWNMLENLFYLMGYTTVLVSVNDPTAVNKFRKRNYNTFLDTINRRTRNSMTLMFKQLELCL